MQIDEQYLTTLVLTTGGNRTQPGTEDYLRGIRFLLGTPNRLLGKHDFLKMLTILRTHGKTYETDFWESVAQKSPLGYLERQLLNHFRVYCVYVQFLQICRVSPDDPLCREFCQELMESYTKAKKAYTDGQTL